MSLLSTPTTFGNLCNRLWTQVEFSRGVSRSLGTNTIWAMFGYVTRLLIQAAYFIVMARCLGVQEYGGFVAIAAIASMFSPLVSLGTGNLLVKHVSRNRSQFAECWGNCLTVTIVSGVTLVLVTIALSAICLPRSIPFTAILLICSADLIFVRVLDMAAFSFLAFEQLAMNARLNILISANRLLGVIAMALLIPKPTVLGWSFVYFTTGVISATIAVTLVKAKLGSPAINLARVRSECREGVYFAVNNSAASSNNDIDKTMVAKLCTLEAAGTYGAAYRLLDVACIPVRALLNAAYPGYFRNGTQGLRGSLHYARPLFRRALPYSVLSMVALFFGGVLVPRILGPRYFGVSEALHWLCPLPLLKTLQLFVADALTGAGYQRCRAMIQSGIAVFNIVINFWAIPTYGWRGAACTSLISDGLLAVTFWLAAFYLMGEVPSARTDSLVAVTTNFH